MSTRTPLCPDDGTLAEYTEGLLPEPRANEVAGHLDRCDLCRRALAGIAKAVAAEAPLAVPRSPPPEEMLRSYLLRDAPQRERSASFVVLLICALGIFLRLVVPGPAPPPFIAARAGGLWLPFVVPLSLCGYELSLLVAFRRGWYRPWVPYVSSLLEMSVPMGFLVIGSILRPAQPIDPVTPLQTILFSPFQVAQGALVMLYAVRGKPSICVIAGAYGAFQRILEYLSVRPSLALSGQVPAAYLPGARAAIFLACGVAGAVLTRHFTRRAVEALRDLREQDLFGKYILRERLGAGGMGEVYRASYCPEGGFNRTVAIKRVRGDLARLPHFQEALIQEARLSSGLHHPNLVQVLDCGRFRGAFMMAMEWVNGVSLDQLLRRLGRPLPPAVVAFVGAELAAALAYLHSRRDERGELLNLVHSDLNPPNVLLSRNGEVKLADFGVARAHRVAAPRGEGLFAGKVAYAAPEQIAGDPLDGRTDLFALGATLYEAATARFAFDDSTRRVPPPPLSAGSEVPGPLAGLIDRLMEPRAERRPAYAAEVRQQLLSLTGALAPFPEGERSLLRELDEALRQDGVVRSAPVRVPDQDTLADPQATTVPRHKS